MAEAEEAEPGLEEVPEVLTEEEKMDRIRAVRYPVIPELSNILQSVYPLFVRKGAKVKTEIHENRRLRETFSHMHEMFFCREIPHLLRALAFNPTEEQIEAIIANARYEEVNQTTKAHFQFDNFEQRLMEHLFNEPDAFKRQPESKLKEAMLTIRKGKNEMDALELKKMMRTQGIAPFTEDEASKMLRVARDKDTGVVYVDEYVHLLAIDGLPPPPDPLEPCDERFR